MKREPITNQPFRKLNDPAGKKIIAPTKIIAKRYLVKVSPINFPLITVLIVLILKDFQNYKYLKEITVASGTT